MKASIRYLITILLLHLQLTGLGQTPTGRVVINEYMPWTSNGCGATAEFVELMNFGPGPVDIGCYVLTDGDYSITIPPNTILLPNQFYVIAGQSFIPFPCANIDSGINVNLNWNNCSNCTSAPIPTTGDGLFTDGGNANEQVVLLHRNGTVVDAVIRNFPQEPSSPITTSNIGGGCNSFSFDLDNYSINYETIGESAGRGNSFARRVDGDCEWIKTPQQSGGATNNKPGNTSEVSFTLTLVNPLSCFNDGAIAINVIGGDETQIFPMSYILVYDQDGDNVFELGDVYQEGIDYTPRIVEVDNLGVGTYRITVASQRGCYLQNFQFTILPCTGPLQTVITGFNLLGTTGGRHQFAFSFGGAADVASVVLEAAMPGGSFQAVQTVPVPQGTEGHYQSRISAAQSGHTLYRLRIGLKNGQTLYTHTVNTAERSAGLNKIWPNPVTSVARLQYHSSSASVLPYQIFSADGRVMDRGRFTVHSGLNLLTLQAAHLPPGSYSISIGGSQPSVFRFVRQ